MTVIDDFVGVGTDIPAYPLDVRQSVSVGHTALYVYGDAAITGDLKVTGDITYDEISGRSLNISGISTFVGVATCGILTAYESITIGSTNVLTELATKSTIGLAIALG